MICIGVHIPFYSFEQENWSNQPNVEDIRKPNISIKYYFTKWRMYMRLTTPCVLPGCNIRHCSNELAKNKHMKRVHGITRDYVQTKRYCFETEQVYKYIKNNDYTETCGICLESLSNGETIKHLPNCIHPFHTCCIDPWLKTNNQDCPLCRKPTNYIDDSEVEQQQHSYSLKITNSKVTFIYISVNQCRSRTSTGKRCKRSCINNSWMNKWCWQHTSALSRIPLQFRKRYKTT